MARYSEESSNTFKEIRGYIFGQIVEVTTVRDLIPVNLFFFFWRSKKKKGCITVDNGGTIKLQCECLADFNPRDWTHIWTSTLPVARMPYARLQPLGRS